MLPRWTSYLVLAGALGAQTVAVTELRLATDPAPAVTRPFETVVMQVRAYGKAPKAGSAGAMQRVRLQRPGAKLSVRTVNGGWVSRAFKYQGTDAEPFYANPASRFGGILDSLARELVLKDSFLYTAPEKEGKYELEAELDGVRGRVTIQVSKKARVRRAVEAVSFGVETFRADPYRGLAEHWSPLVAQETWFTPKADTPVRFDYDGDWQGDNNWDDLERGSAQAYVHYAAIESVTHWFLIYNFFHPRDYDDRCFGGTCHENDNEGLILTVRKDGSTWGALEAMETLAHNNVYSYAYAAGVRSGLKQVQGRVELFEGSHPIVFVEGGGHGVYGSADRRSGYSAADNRFLRGTGTTFVYKGKAERARHANDRLVGYELVPIEQVWWPKTVEGSGWRERTFDEFFSYAPFGDRPSGMGRMIGGAFYGRKEAANKAKPFWGWHDNALLKNRVLAVGQWAMDPAYGVSRDLTFPAGLPFSTEYVFNPYLGIERKE